MSRQSTFFERIRLHTNPVAAAASQVVRGQARFTVLTSRLLRLEWSATGVFEDRATLAFINRAAKPPPFTVKEGAGTLTIDTGALQLRYRLGSGPFSPANLQVTLELNGVPVTWLPGTPNSGNLRGTRRTLDGAPGPVTLGEGLISRDGWAVHDDSSSVVFTEDLTWVTARPDHALQDWYFFGYGHAYTDALTEYTQFGGALPLIPRFVLGAWWSRYWAYSDQDLKKIVDDFAEHDLPLDVLVVDMDWHTPESWTGYTWNRDLFPDPEGFLRWVHERGLQVTLNLHPAEGVQAFEEVYPRFAEALGVDPASRETVRFRPGDPTFMRHYFEILHHPMEEQGVDFWWLDWQQGEASDIEGLDPLIWLNHLHFLDSARRGRRPMLYSRWGGLGNHRYQIGFSGDTFSMWPALQYQPYFTATAANVLYGWWSHDIGGHFGAPSPELFARWVQFGALSPCLRLHSTKDPLSERRPWAFSPAVLSAAREAFHLRYRLVPYLYTMAREAADSGIALCRPLYYSYPEADAAYLSGEAYFLGDRVIAAPIVRPGDPATGMASADVWVPPGTWIDYQTLESFTGPRWVRLVGDLERVPMLVRAGTVLPLPPPAPTTSAIPADRLVLEVFPGPESDIRLYEDDGVTLEYQRDQYEWTPISMETVEDGRACRVLIGPTEGRCDTLPAGRSYEVKFRATQQVDRVLVNGEDAADWSYSAEYATTTVKVPSFEKRAQVEIIIAVPNRVWADAEPHGRACVLADVRRLLGSACPEVPWESLPAAVGQLDHPGRNDALARLGGPFVQVLEYSTLPEAARQLGTVVVAAPADGTPFDVSAEWTLHGTGGVEKRTQAVTGALGDKILACPFAFNISYEAMRWEATVDVRWKGINVAHRYKSATLYPAVPVWRIAETGPQKASNTVAPVPTADTPDLRWQKYEADPEALGALTEPFRVELTKMYKLSAGAGEGRGAPQAAYAVASFVSPKEQEVCIAYSNLGTGGCRLNGLLVEEAAPGTAPQLRIPPPMSSEAHITVPVMLRAGANELVLTLIPAQGAPEWQFAIGAVLVDKEGTVITGVHYTNLAPTNQG